MDKKIKHNIDISDSDSEISDLDEDVKDPIYSTGDTEHWSNDPEIDMFEEPNGGIVTLIDDDEEFAKVQVEVVVNVHKEIQIEARIEPMEKEISKEAQRKEDEQEEEEWGIKTRVKPKKKKKILKPKAQGKSSAKSQEKPKTYENLFKQKKKTNMPKFFIKLFRITLQKEIQALKSMAPTPENQERKSWLDQTLIKVRRIQRQKHITTRNIKAFFGNGRPENRIHRIMMKKRLSVGLFEGVLMNDDIKEENKFTYMRFWKTMEWRLRSDDASLMGRIQSF